jgi:hypothetical protein
MFKQKYISSTRACIMMSVALFLLFIFMRVAICAFTLASFLEIVTWNTLNHMINFHFWSPSYPISWFNKDRYLEKCDSSLLAWSIEFNMHLLFYITSGTSTRSLMLPLLRCMIHHSQVLINPSSTTILIHTSPYTFHKHSCSSYSCCIRMLIFVLLTWSSCSYSCCIRMLSSWPLCFSCLAYYWFFNVEPSFVDIIHWSQDSICFKGCASICIF